MWSFMAGIWLFLEGNRKNAELGMNQIKNKQANNKAVY
jgi:hypothetical protein